MKTPPPPSPVTAPSPPESESNYTSWDVARPDAEGVRELVSELGVSPLAASLLVNRGVDTPETARHFLEPRLRDLPSPLLMKGMAEAVERILRAIRDDEPIALWGDYDVDGVTSVSLLLLFLRELGVPARYHIPNRMNDGYGLSRPHIERLAGLGIQLLITVDCGISGVEEVRFARSLGMDVVIIDHHQVPEQLPDAAAIVDPLQPGCTFPFKGMAACGLTFYVLIALRSALRERHVFDRMKEPDLRRYLDIVGLGTIADVVPLVEQNRTFALRGLEELTRTKRPGIRALREVCGLQEGPMDSASVGFGMAPRINAVGRLSDARSAVELLTSVEPERARMIADELEHQNRARRELQQRIFEEAVARVERQETDRHAPAFVLADDGWHPGVVGIVASKLVERFFRPAVLIAMKDGVGKGSGRSIDSVNLYEGLGSCRDLLDAYGGHSQAGGITIRQENIEAFRARFEAFVEEGERRGPVARSLALDAVLPLASVDRALLDEVGRLAPFGSANRAPTFASHDVRVESARVVGEHHLQLTVSQDGVSRDAIAFQMAHLRPTPGSLIDLAYRPEISRWRGQERLRLRVLDLRPSRREA